ncbi:uncharacterized protein LOC134713954 [Mytilus trossulus]|uniref:uncharacterized protein LOC134713954 n=1 Tax=Mytilus trossulus TaxID=6551 RepID=UPI003004FF65
MTLNGAKDVPVRGFLLSENKSDVAPMTDAKIITKLDSIEKKINLLDAVMTKVDRLKEITNTSTQRLTAIEMGLKDMKKDVKDIPFSNVHRETTGYIGCYKDCGGRMLNAKSNMHVNDLSLAKCKSICKGYKYLGLQYTRQCFCGNKMDTVKFPRVPDSECKMPCSKEKSRMCGGGCRNSIYYV